MYKNKIFLRFWQRKNIEGTSKNSDSRLIARRGGPKKPGAYVKYVRIFWVRNEESGWLAEFLEVPLRSLMSRSLFLPKQINKAAKHSPKQSKDLGNKPNKEDQKQKQNGQHNIRMIQHQPKAQDHQGILGQG